MNTRTVLLTLLVSTAIACGDKEPAPSPEQPAAKAEAAAEAKPEAAPAADAAAAPAADAEAAPAADAEAAPAADASAAPVDGVLKPDAEGIVRLEATDTMQYNAKRIEVEGTKVKIELKHVGKLDIKLMGHNLVVLKPGSDTMMWSGKAVSAADNGYVPADDPELIAHTKLLGGGDSDTIEFEVPGPGEYPFLCSFPGHAGMMKGVLVVK